MKILKIPAPKLPKFIVGSEAVDIKKNFAKSAASTNSKNSWVSAVQKLFSLKNFSAALQFLLEVLAWLKTWRQVRFFVESSCCSPVVARKNVFNVERKIMKANETCHVFCGVGFFASWPFARLRAFRLFSKADKSWERVFLSWKNRFFLHKVAVGFISFLLHFTLAADIFVHFLYSRTKAWTFIFASEVIYRRRTFKTRRAMSDRQETVSPIKTIAST